MNFHDVGFSIARECIVREFGRMNDHRNLDAILYYTKVQRTTNWLVSPVEVVMVVYDDIHVHITVPASIPSTSLGSRSPSLALSSEATFANSLRPPYYNGRVTLVVYQEHTHYDFLTGPLLLVGLALVNEDSVVAT
jgi:hypothetical protein